MFDRFGQWAYTPVPLDELGLADAWPKLRELQAEVSSLIARHAEAMAEVQKLEASLEAARKRDTEAAGRALRSGEKVPDASHEHKVEVQLKGARRNVAAYEAATSSAIAEVEELKRTHAAELHAAAGEQLQRLRARLSEQAGKTAALYSQVAGAEQNVRRLTPPVPVQETGAPGTEAAQRTTVIAPVLTTGRDAGPERGEVEAILAYLQDLGG